MNTTKARCSDRSSVDCDLDLDKLPVVTIGIGDQKFEITPKYYVKIGQPAFCQGIVECTVVFSMLYDGRPSNNYSEHI